MKYTILIFSALLFLLNQQQQASAAVVITYRGQNPNVIGLDSGFYDTPFDIDNNGVADLVFHSNGILASLLPLNGTRYVGFIDPTQFYSDQVAPVQFGQYITADGPFPMPNTQWVLGNEHGQTAGFLLGYADHGGGLMQYANAYIGVEFRRGTDVHYGWIKYIGFGVLQIPFYINGNLIGYVNGSKAPGGNVDAWGWETTPGVGLVAGVPEPGRTLLGLIGMGQILFRRRRF
jgi:hypothetical protein